MCIAILLTPEAEITKKTLRNCFSSNGDGIGFAYINTDDNGVPRIRIKKDLKFNSFYHRFRQARRENEESPFLLHFRITTHGGTRIENCHPFQIDKESAFIHNGIIQKSVKCIEGKESDTRAFNRTILRTLPKGWKENIAIKEMIEEYIGSFSKLVMIHTDYTFEIYNEEKGVWDDDVWFSNTSYKESPWFRGTNYQNQSWKKGTQWKNGGSEGGYYANKNKKNKKNKKNGKATTIYYDKNGKQVSMGKAVVTVFSSGEKKVESNTKKEHDSKIKVVTTIKKGASTQEVHRKCDCCGEFHELHEIEYYRLSAYDAEGYCIDCSDMMIKNLIIKRTDELRYFEYLDILDDPNYKGPGDWEYPEEMEGNYVGH